MHRPRYLVLFALSLMALAGCPRNAVKPTADAGAGGTGETVQSTGADAAGTQAAGVGTEESAARAAAAVLRRRAASSISISTAARSAASSLRRSASTRAR